MQSGGGHVGASESNLKIHIFATIFCAALFAAGCNDDNSGKSTEKTCGEHEFKFFTNVEETEFACECDIPNHYYGTPGDCKLCTGEYKGIIETNKGSECVCVEGTVDDGNGGCRSTCGEHEKVSEEGKGCVCDHSANYYGTPGNCKLCEGEHRIITNYYSTNGEYSCECEPSYKENELGGCTKSNEPTCGIGGIVKDGACVCDYQSNWYGKPPNCSLCEGTGKIVKDNACVCDEANNYFSDGNGGCSVYIKKEDTFQTCSDWRDNDGNGLTDCEEDDCKMFALCIEPCEQHPNGPAYGEPGKCKFCGGDNLTLDHIVADNDNNDCLCDNANNYYGTPGSCTLCEGEGKTVKDNECVCDIDNHFTTDGDTCKCDPGYELKEGKCTQCEAGYYSKDGVCTQCDGTAFLDNCITQSGFADVVTFGRYYQYGNIGRQTLLPIEWFPLEIDTAQHKILLRSRFTIAARQYDDKSDTTKQLAWVNSTLRMWLNDNFINIAFTPYEQQQIITTHLDNSDEYEDYTWTLTTPSPSQDTDDKVFLLTFNEFQPKFNLPCVEGFVGGEDDSYYTDFSCNMYNRKYSQYRSTKIWTRTTSGWSSAEAITDDGNYYDGHEIDKNKLPVTDRLGIVPAIWVQY